MLTIIENPQLFAGAVFSTPAIVNKTGYIQVCHSKSTQITVTHWPFSNQFHLFNKLLLDTFYCTFAME